MQIYVRACKQNEFRRFLETCETAFGFDVKDSMVERFRRIITPDRMLAAFDDDSMVGTTGSFPFTLTVPGGEIPAGGVTMVGVMPSHRRRGVLTELMRAHLEEARRCNEPVAALWASEGSIYQRYGYGLATKQASIDVERDRSRFLQESPGEGRCRLLTFDEATKVLPDIYERVRINTPGMYARTSDWWQAETLADPEDDRMGGGPMWRVVWEHEGRAEAYALYRVHNDWEEGMPAGWLNVIEAIGTSPLATREIWRFLFGVDLVTRIKSWFLPVDHPLFLMLAEPRRLRFTVKDALWLRIVDLPAALEARSYTREGSLVLEITDHLCPDNQGRWKLEVTDSGARVARTEEEADLSLGIAEIGAAYLGGVGFCELTEAGRARELRAGAALRATTMFLTPRAPWCAEVF